MRTNLIKPKNISEAKSKTSNDGMLDMVIEKTEKDTGERLVNINTISQLIYNGVKYTVE